ncbi:MAG: circadian clock KaiB family protein [Bacteroidota bacterium]
MKLKRKRLPPVTGTEQKEHNDHRRWNLRLYIAGRTLKAAAAIANLHVICNEQLKGKYRLTVIDLAKDPELARMHQIIAVPTLVRTSPLPERFIIGDLSNTERLLAGLDIA